MMDNRLLGKSALLVSPLCFGGNVFGWTLNEQESFRILDSFVDKGFNFIDTADSYSTWVPGNKGGESETIIGKWMKQQGNREKLIIATKLGSDMGNGKKGLRAVYVKSAVEDSLRRLQTDYIDLYQSHYDDPATTVEETMTAFDQLVKEGKVRYLGASNVAASRIKASNDFARNNDLSPYISLQPLYNLYSRSTFEQEYQSLVEEESLAVINYYALASGFLTGKYRSTADLDKSKRGPGIEKYLDDRGLRILAAMDEVAAHHAVQVSQIAIAWLLHQPFITSPIASATSEQQLVELTAAVSLQLSSAEMALLQEASAY